MFQNATARPATVRQLGSAGEDRITIEVNSEDGAVTTLFSLDSEKANRLAADLMAAAYRIRDGRPPLMSVNTAEWGNVWPDGADR